MRPNASPVVYSRTPPVPGGWPGQLPMGVAVPAGWVACVRGCRQTESGTPPRPRVHEDLVLLVEPRLLAEEPERLGHPDQRGPERDPPALPVHAPRRPRHRLAAQGDHPARLVLGEAAEVD